MSLLYTASDIPRVICSVFALCGGVIMAIDVGKFYRMIQRCKQESYLKQPTNVFIEHLSYGFMALFVIGYIVGTIDLFMRDVEFVYMFVAVIFAMAAVFLFMILNILENLLDSVRDKTTELMKSYVNSIEMKDPYTKGHSQHVTRLVEIFYSHLPLQYSAEINLSKLLDAALLHDCMTSAKSAFPTVS